MILKEDCPDCILYKGQEECHKCRLRMQVERFPHWASVVSWVLLLALGITLMMVIMTTSLTCVSEL